MTLKEAIEITKNTDDYNITQIIEAAEVIMLHIKAGYILIDFESLKEELEEYREQTAKDCRGNDRCELCDLTYWESIKRIVESYGL